MLPYTNLLNFKNIQFCVYVNISNKQQYKKVYRGMNLVGHAIKSSEKPLELHSIWSHDQPNSYFKLSVFSYLHLHVSLYEPIA